MKNRPTSIFLGAAKNVPPFLSAYLKPFNLVPKHASRQGQIQQERLEYMKRSGSKEEMQLAFAIDDRQKKYGFKSDMMSYSQLTEGFQGEARRQVCVHLEGCTRDLKYMHSQQDRIISALQAIVQPKQVEYITPPEHVQRYIENNDRQKF